MVSQIKNLIKKCTAYFHRIQFYVELFNCMFCTKLKIIIFYCNISLYFFIAVDLFKINENEGKTLSNLY